MSIWSRIKGKSDAEELLQESVKLIEVFPTENSIKDKDLKESKEALKTISKYISAFSGKLLKYRKSCPKVYGKYKELEKNLKKDSKGISEYIECIIKNKRWFEKQLYSCQEVSESFKSVKTKYEDEVKSFKDAQIKKLIERQELEKEIKKIEDDLIEAKKEAAELVKKYDDSFDYIKKTFEFLKKSNLKDEELQPTVLQWTKSFFTSVDRQTYGILFDTILKKMEEKEFKDLQPLFKNLITSLSQPKDGDEQKNKKIVGYLTECNKRIENLKNAELKKITDARGFIDKENQKFEGEYAKYKEKAICLEYLGAYLCGNQKRVNEVKNKNPDVDFELFVKKLFEELNSHSAQVNLNLVKKFGIWDPEKVSKRDRYGKNHERTPGEQPYKEYFDAISKFSKLYGELGTYYNLADGTCSSVLNKLEELKKPFNNLLGEIKTLENGKFEKQINADSQSNDRVIDKYKFVSILATSPNILECIKQELKTTVEKMSEKKKTIDGLALSIGINKKPENSRKAGPDVFKESEEKN